MERCVQLAEQGNLDVAEDELIEFFTDREKVHFLITRLMTLNEFSPRKTLMSNALEDHFTERYHASVPLFLMMIDGLVNDFENVGFFAESVELTVWDTIVAHDSGLSTIANIFNRSRKKTTDEEIVLPFRNGILHGRDLGYANVQVSSKALSTLLALRDWADAIKDGKKSINKEFVHPTKEEVYNQTVSSLEQLQETRNELEYMDNWVRRDLKVGKDFPEKGEVGDYSDGSPERVLIEFIYYLKKNNFGNMAKLISNSYLEDRTISKLAGELREIFAHTKLIDFRLVNVYETAPAISVIEMFLDFERVEAQTQFKVLHNFRLCYEEENGKLVARGYKKAEWKIMIHTIRELEFSYL